MSARKKDGGGAGSWALIVFLFAVGIWPLALILLFFKLFGDDDKQKTARTNAQAFPQGEQAGPAAKAVRSVTRSPVEKKSTARILKLAGAIVAVVGVCATGSALDDMLYLFDTVRYWLPDLLQGLALLAGGGAMVYSGFAMDRQLKRYARYLSVAGQREAVPVEELSRTLGYPPARVEKDLQRMIDKGYFGSGAYLDVSEGCLFRDARAGESWKQARRPAAPPPKETEEGYSGILRNIRRANDEIADPVLSAKIDRLESVAAKIFQAVETDPKKREQIGTLLDYYLPTTQKLLDSYAQFESAGIEGENLRQAKEQISTTMDSIVKGFERQLDALYKADALDVDSDIRVMEHMLRRDTATTEDDFGLGTAVQETEE